MRPPGLIPRIVLPIAAGGIYFLIAHYEALEPDARRHAILITMVLGVYGVLQYLFQQFHRIMPRVVITITAGGLFYLIAHYAFSYRYAESLGIMIIGALAWVVILEGLFKGFFGTIMGMLICILGGGLFYLIAHYVFSDPYAATLGGLTAAASALLIDMSPTDGRAD
jgi:energy-converting hydrogenase Eha subunit G